MYNPARDMGNIVIKTQNEDKQKKKQTQHRKRHMLFFWSLRINC